MKRMEVDALCILSGAHAVCLRHVGLHLMRKAKALAKIQYTLLNNKSRL